MSKSAPRHPRLWIILTLAPALIGAALSIYHLIVVATDLNDQSNIPMMSGAIGTLYLAYNYIIMLLPIAFCYLCALLVSVFRSHLLGKGSYISIVCLLAYALTEGALIGFGAGSGLLFVTLLLALGAIAASTTTLLVAFDLTAVRVKRERDMKKD